jgi:hypothetical protein
MKGVVLQDVRQGSLVDYQLFGGTSCFISISISIYLTFHRSTVHIRYRTCQSKIIYSITRQLLHRAYKVKYSDKYVYNR